jgi:hypothetical protein
MEDPSLDPIVRLEAVARPLLTFLESIKGKDSELIFFTILTETLKRRQRTENKVDNGLYVRYTIESPHDLRYNMPSKVKCLNHLIAHIGYQLYTLQQEICGNTQQQIEDLTALLGNIEHAHRIFLRIL